MNRRNWHLVPTIRDRGGRGARGGPGSPGGPGGPRRQGGSGSRWACLRRAEAFRRHHLGGHGLDVHGSPAVQEHKQEGRQAPRTHRPAEPDAACSAGPALPGNRGDCTPDITGRIPRGCTKPRGGRGTGGDGPEGRGLGRDGGRCEACGGRGNCECWRWFPSRRRCLF